MTRVSGSEGSTHERSSFADAQAQPGGDPDQGGPDQRARLIFVVGCPRSGTSLFAKLLSSSGLRTAYHAQKNRQYPSGHFEHMPLLMFTKAMERLPRGAHHRITTEPLLRSDYLEDEFICRIFQAAWEPVLNRSVDFMKHPQLALASDFLFEQFRDIHVIALWRNPVCTFRSLVSKEFPQHMIPTSGLRAVLLWNVYAYNVVQAAANHPGDVTVLCIDDLIREDSSISPLLWRLGYAVGEGCYVSQCIQRDVWTTRVSWPWQVFFHGVRLGALTMRRFLHDDQVALADLAAWQRRLRAVTVDLSRANP